MDPLSRLSETSRQILHLARKEAAFFQHDQIRTEHILLAIAAVPESAGSRLLRRMGVDPQAAVRAVLGHLRIGAAADPGALTLAPEARRALAAAWEEAQRAGGAEIGGGHLLLGLLAEPGGIAARALAGLGVDADAVRRAATAGPGEESEGRPARGARGDPADAAAAAADARARAVDEGPGGSAGSAGPPAVRFDKFTERAKKVLVLAQEEAQRFNHNYIGTEHLLLGLVREGEGIAAKVLSNLGVELNRVRPGVEFIVGRGERTVKGDISLTPRAKKVIELAVEEARRLNHNYIGTEHLLLGLVREGEGIAAGVLESLGVNLEKVRTQVMTVVGRSGSGVRRAAAAAAGAGPTSAAGPVRVPPTDAVGQTGPRFGAPGTETITCRLGHRASETLDVLVEAGAFRSRCEAVDRLLDAALETARAALQHVAESARRRAGAGEERGQPPPAGPTVVPGG